MLSKLREKNAEVPVTDEPTRVITVRLPKSLHEALRAEAHTRQTSMNQLCISKLLQIIEQQFVPAEAVRLVGSRMIVNCVQAPTSPGLLVRGYGGLAASVVAEFENSDVRRYGFSEFPTCTAQKRDSERTCKPGSVRGGDAAAGWPFL